MSHHSKLPVPCFPWLILGPCLLLSFPAQAYMDPNLGSMLLQGLLASIAAAGVAARMYWHRIVAFFSKDSAADNEAEDES